MRLRMIAAAALSLLFAACNFSSALAAAGVTADVQAIVKGRYTGSNDLGTPTFAFDQVRTNQYSPGAASGQADKLFSDERTLAASATENLDLAGSLVDPLGGTLTFAKVKAIIVYAAAANTNSVCVGAAASNTFTGPFLDATDAICVKPGGMLVISDPVGWTVTASTGDILKVTNSSSGTGVTYKVIVLGASS